MFANLLQRLRRIAPSQGERRLLALGLTGLAAACTLSFHFAMTLLQVQPNNPFRDEVAPLVSGYMQPYFEQNWLLFAPSPEEPSRRLAVACRFAEPGRPDTEVIDITAPHLEQFHRQRLSSSQRLIRAQLYPLMRVHQQKDAVTTALEKLADSPDEAERAIAQALLEREEAARQSGLRLLARIGSVECDRRFPDAKVASVQVQYFQERAPKFSQRNEPEARGEALSYDYGWLPHEKVALY